MRLCACGCAPHWSDLPPRACSPVSLCSANDENTANYTTQPHTELDCVLSTLSMGPVGISDALNYTNVPLISQAFTSPTDGTLLRPSRPVSWVDSVFANMSAGAFVVCGVLARG